MKNFSIFLVLIYLINLHIISEISSQSVENTDTLILAKYKEQCMKYMNKNMDTALFYIDSIDQLITDKDFDFAYPHMHNLLGLIQNRQGNVDSALQHFNIALEYYNELNINSEIPGVLNNIGLAYSTEGNYEKALEFFMEAIRKMEKMDDIFWLANVNTNIGSVYKKLNKYDLAFEYQNKAHELMLSNGEQKYIAGSLNNLGDIFKEQGEYKKAVEYFEKAIEINIKEENDSWLAINYNNMGISMYYLGDPDKAFYYFNLAGEIYVKLNSIEGQVYNFNNMGYLSSELNNQKTAIEYYQEGLNLSVANNLKYWTMKLYGNMYVSYKKTGDYKNAFDHLLKYTAVKDSVLNENNLRNIEELEAKYQNEKKKLQIENLEKDNMLQANLIKIKEYESKIQNRIMFGLAILLVIVAIFLFFIYRLFIQKKQANQVLSQQKEEIAAQRDEIEAQRDLAAQQRDLIADQKQDITDSIEYAYRIQSAIFPDPNEIKLLLKEYFIFYKPRDIVSGDFYWINKQDNKIIIIAADCTGHGVPGAFMSMLGVAFLNDIVNKENITKPATILNRLRENVILALKQHNKESVQQDGMDVAAITIDPQNNKIEFAGANNPLYFIKNNELIEVKGDKMPVSIYIRMKPFSNYERNISKGDVIYIFSDGYADQFGGPQGKKFKYKNFKELLLRNSAKPMLEQERILNETFDTWKANYNQIDDVLVMGIKV